MVRRIELFPLTRIQTTSALRATDAGKTLRHMEQGYIGKEGTVNTLEGVTAQMLHPNPQIRLRLTLIFLYH